MLEAMHINKHNPLSLLLSNLLSTALLVTLASSLKADDWMTWSSTYTHSPQTGQRIDQYASGEQPISPYREDFTRSGFRHFRSTLQAGQSADNMHIVEQWGQPVIPYEQWRFPFRPYAVPYDAWGPQAPYGITNSSIQLGVGAGPWGGQAGGPHRPAPGSGSGPGYGPTVGYGPGYGAGGYASPGNDAPAGQEGNFPGRNFYPHYPPPQRPGHWEGYPAGSAGGNNPYQSRGFPLTPTYNREPWYDGGYPTVPPLGER